MSGISRPRLPRPIAGISRLRRGLPRRTLAVSGGPSQWRRRRPGRFPPRSLEQGVPVDTQGSAAAPALLKALFIIVTALLVGSIGYAAWIVVSYWGRVGV